MVKNVIVTGNVSHIHVTKLIQDVMEDMDLVQIIPKLVVDINIKIQQITQEAGLVHNIASMYQYALLKNEKIDFI